MNYFVMKYLRMQLPLMVVVVLLASLPHGALTAQPTGVSARKESKIRRLKRNLQETWELYKKKKDDLTPAEKEKLEMRLRSIRRALIALGVTAVTIATILGYKAYRGSQAERERLERERLAEAEGGKAARLIVEARGEAKAREAEKGRRLQEEIEPVKTGYEVDEDIARNVLAHFKKEYPEKYMTELKEDIEKYLGYKAGSHDTLHIQFFFALGGITMPRGGYYWLFEGAGRANCPRFAEDADPAYKQTMVNVYKIHLMPKIKDINNTVARLMMSDEIRNNVGEIKLKANIRDIGDLPILVLYACQGKEQAQLLLDEVCHLFAGQEGLNITPRYNKRVNSLIYFAQGNGDDKGRLAARGELNKYFTRGGVYYSREINTVGGNPDYELRGCGG